MTSERYTREGEENTVYFVGHVYRPPVGAHIEGDVLGFHVNGRVSEVREDGILWKLDNGDLGGFISNALLSQARWTYE